MEKKCENNRESFVSNGGGQATFNEDVGINPKKEKADRYYKNKKNKKNDKAQVKKGKKRER